MKNASLLCVLSLNFEGQRSVLMSCEIPMPPYCIKQKPLLSCEITQTWEKEIPFIKFFFPPHLFITFCYQNCSLPSFKGQLWKSVKQNFAAFSLLFSSVELLKNCGAWHCCKKTWSPASVPRPCPFVFTEAAGKKEVRGARWVTFCLVLGLFLSVVKQGKIKQTERRWSLAH